MIHSTGADNLWLKRYVDPDDGKLGKNQYNNHWNTYHPGGREVCVHGFISKLANGSIATYQTLPWEHRGWHAGGSVNDTHIGFEICEDGKIDIILTKAIPRFARNTVNLLETVRHLKELVIEVRFEKERINSLSGNGEVMLTLLASFAQEEIISLSNNVKWETRKRMEQGISTGHFRVFGYR